MNNLQTWAGWLTWLVVFSLSTLQLYSSTLLLEAVVLQLAVLALLVIATNQSLHENRAVLATVCFWLMLVVVLMIGWRIAVGYFFIYSIIWVAVAPSYCKPRTCWVLLALVSACWYGIRALVWQESSAFAETLLTGTFHVFALVSSQTARQSALANERTQEMNRQLVATQHLLGEASKDSERTRIARDLHDLLGHHLTALSINLQVASRLTEGEAKHKVDQCHGLAKLLLSDVREAVGLLRQSYVDLYEVLELAVKDIPRLNIKLDFDRSLNVHDVTIAEVVLRCVQEAITNSLRHSNSKNMQIKIRQQHRTLQIGIEDDGAGADQIIEGNGLHGMRERVERAGGTLDVTSFGHMQLAIELPLSNDSRVTTHPPAIASSNSLVQQEFET